MRSIEDKGCLNIVPMPENSPSTNSNKFEFVHKGNGPNRAFGKPAPSKWDDAQKWLVNLSRGGPESKSEKPRDSNADDRRLIAPVPKTEDYSSGGEDMNGTHFDGETKNVDSEEVPVWRINKRINNPHSIVRSICVRDMGTEMTPIASQEPSRNATPIRVMSPNRSPSSSSESSTPVRTVERVVEGSQGNVVAAAEGRGGGGGGGGGFDEFRGGQKKNSEQEEKTSGALEIRAAAWDEAERAKYMARYRREEVKIQAWENHEKRKAEMEMRRMEVKAEQLKTRAQEKLANKLAATRRIAEEKLANAEAKLNEQAVRTSERADYIRRTGHLPSSFSFKLPSWCW